MSYEKVNLNERVAPWRRNTFVFTHDEVDEWKEKGVSTLLLVSNDNETAVAVPLNSLRRLTGLYRGTSILDKPRINLKGLGL